jgi:hypothetical protein
VERTRGCLRIEIRSQSFPDIVTEQFGPRAMRISHFG